MELTESKRRRVRRSPEQARALILEGAKRVLAEKGPDGASLSAVADEVGVSHSLVVHYFGSYEALVNAAVSDQLRQVGAKVWAEAIHESPPGAETLVEGLFEALRSPEMGRTVGWALLTGRLTGPELLSRLGPDPERFPNMLESYLQKNQGTDAPARQSSEFALAIAISAALGYALSGELLWRVLGKEPDESLDFGVRAQLVELVRDQLVGLNIEQRAATTYPVEVEETTPPPYPIEVKSDAIA